MSTFEINLEYEGRNSNVVMGMYIDSSLADDIDMIGWNLCDCNDEIFKNKIGNCRIVSENVKKGKANVIVELCGIDEALKEKIIENLLDSFDDLLWREKMGLRSRTGESYELDNFFVSFTTNCNS